MPAGQAETKLVVRTPLPASLRHMPGKLIRGIAGTMPEHELEAMMPPVRLTCVRKSVSLAIYIRYTEGRGGLVCLTFSSSVSWDTKSLAFP